MLINDIYRWARIQPGKTAVIHDDHSVDYATFARAIEVTRRFLVRQQLPPDATVVIVVYNLLEAWFIDIAFRPLGLKTLALSFVEHVEHMKIRDLCCVVTTESEATRSSSELSSRAGVPLIVVPKSIYAAISHGELPLPIADEVACGGQILSTSGSTGSRKMLLRESRIESTRIATRARAHGFDRNTVHYLGPVGLCASPPQARSPSVWHAGGTVVVDQNTELRRRLFDGAVNGCWLPIPVFKKLVMSDESDDRRLDCKIEVGGGTLPVSVAQKALQITNHASVIFGTSETPGPVMSCNIHYGQTQFWFAVAEDRTIEIVDDRLVECATGREGMLRIKLTDLDCSHYIDDPDATSKVFRDGYFYSGDLAVQRTDGRIRVHGRVEDVINLQGTKMAVVPLEQKLQRYLQVEDVCLFTYLNDDGQDELIVAIQSSSAPPTEKLDNVRRQAHFTEHVRFAIFKDFPRTEMGKVQRIMLREFVVSENAKGR